ncbi:transporter substrate-binding domain-containing protein [Rhodococcoides kyotonense]|uniref:Polar amino acid transport system substrate-binding protein n=1 Tax=Rhodococcoides kyotonense TaxID=398843 RepID=A0A239LYM1_9NOCA|nr:transporter substrate-binding domain-containing protein [Rhodococcus kyotonensis]SNT35616.1 polar amino acid transport system substrate-binding protein [Rhodococcus kyotonensis]
MKNTLVRTVAACIGVVAISATTACGAANSDSAPATSVESARVAEIADSVPASISSKGSLAVGAAAYAPAVIAPGSGGQPSGWEVALMNEAAAVMGLTADYTMIPFDGILTGLEAGRYDAGVGEVAVRAERVERVNFAVNHTTSNVFLAPADNTRDEYSSIQDVCGSNIGVMIGTNEAAAANDIVTECENAGQQGTKVTTFQDQSTVNLALSESRIDVDLTSDGQAAYVLQQTGDKFKIVPLGFGPTIETGVAFQKTPDGAALANAYASAIDHLIATGRYQDIIDEFVEGLGPVEVSKTYTETGQLAGQ